MGFYEYLDTFAGLPVVEWTAGEETELSAGKAYRITLSYNEADDGIAWADRLAEFLTNPGSSEVEGIVVGLWGESGGPEGVTVAVEALVASREKLPRLRALFVGDITADEWDVAYIEQGDLSALLGAFPNLEHLGTRGGIGLSFGTLRSPKLKSLIIQSGGLPGAVVREVANADLPELEHLELWLGTDDYGAEDDITEVLPIIAGKNFPKLRYLGLRNSILTDQIAAELVKSPLLERIETLDLSLGTLSDEGGQVLLDSPAVLKLKKLILSHHFLSQDMEKKLLALGPNIEADRMEAELDDGDEPYRYVAVSE